jgi:hypothetical protein
MNNDRQETSQYREWPGMAWTMTGRRPVITGNDQEWHEQWNCPCFFVLNVIFTYVNRTLCNYQQEFNIQYLQIQKCINGRRLYFENDQKLWVAKMVEIKINTYPQIVYETSSNKWPQLTVVQIFVCHWHFNQCGSVSYSCTYLMLLFYNLYVILTFWTTMNRSFQKQHQETFN